MRAFARLCRWFGSLEGGTSHTSTILKLFYLTLFNTRRFRLVEALLKREMISPMTTEIWDLNFSELSFPQSTRRRRFNSETKRLTPCLKKQKAPRSALSLSGVSSLQLSIMLCSHSLNNAYRSSFLSCTPPHSTWAALVSTPSPSALFWVSGRSEWDIQHRRLPETSTQIRLQEAIYCFRRELFIVRSNVPYHEPPRKTFRVC